jgi:serine/threonine protein kinase
MASEVGALIAGRYRLLVLVGVGGMGSVWRAHDEVLDREVAAKQVAERPGLTPADQEVGRRRVLREARAAARLAHRGVVTVFDVVEDRGRLWIIMELVEARSLQDVLDSEGPMPPARAAALGLQVLEALAHAHQKGVLHRDVKPSNVLVTADGRAVLTDFGIAQREGDPRLTQTGAVVGSPAFMAPEQIQGGPVTGAADLWSLGVTLYAAVEGRSPFQRTDPMASVAAVLTAELPKPQRAGPLTPVLAGLLQRDSASRLTASAAMAALSAITSEQPTAPLSGGGQASGALSAVHRTQRLPAPRSGPSRTVVVTAVALTTALAVLAIVLVISNRWGGNGHAAGAVARSSADSSATASAAQSSTSTGTAAGFHRYRDQSDFSVPVPDGWSGPERQGSSVFFYSPGRGSLIQIDQTTTPSASAIQDWRNQEITVSGNRPGYRRVKIVPSGDAPPVPDTVGDRSADWEFTYDGAAGRRHVLNRGFVISGRGYAILIAAPDAQWSSTLTHLGPVFAGFTPVVG